ncbi:MAG: Serine/threonine-protein kinase PknD [Anaerolineae bacterium]|nr:Serine/threonine-protein kinase PknD [Anaerolineae bacterium]
MAQLKLFLLGPPRVELDGAPVDLNRRKALALLVYLAVTGQPHSRDAMATLLYPDYSQSHARSYLRRDLAIVNTALVGDWLDTDRDTIELKRTPGFWLDVEQFRSFLAQCRAHDHDPHLPCADCLPLLNQAVALYTADFLAGFTLRDCPEFDDWQFFQTESLRQELAATLEQLVSGCLQHGQPEDAIPHGRRWVALDPLHEPAQRALIQLYDQAGHSSAALRQYEEFTALLEEELGLPPEEETTTLYEAIKARRLLGPFLKQAEVRRDKDAAEKQTKPRPAQKEPGLHQSVAAGKPATSEKIVPVLQPPAEHVGPKSSSALKLEQQIHTCQTSSGVQLAYATVGSGPPLVKAANWLSHLEYDWQSPVWRHWLASLAQHHTLIRYDKRGCGLSDWEVDDFSLEAQVNDLEAVVNALGLDRFPLLGLSGGGPVAVAYTARHPEKVSYLILYGSYVRGRLKRSQNLEQIEEAQTLFKAMELGWGKANPAFRQLYTGLFIPEGTAEQIHWYNELQRISTTPEIAVKMLTASATVDVAELAAQVTAPTLVLHAQNDALTPISQGRQLAESIPGARFVALDSQNHILLEHEPAWQQFLSEVRGFLGIEEGQPVSLPPAPAAIRPVPSETPGRPAPTAMQPVGREQELAQLHAALDTARQGKRQLVFITGEAGQGKSTLIEAFVAQARAAGHMWLGQGQSIEHRGAGEAYMPVLEAFSRLCQEPGGHALISLLDQVAPTWLAQMPWLVTAEAYRRLKHRTQAATRERMLREMVEAVEMMTAQQPLLLVLEDLHWSDYSTLDLLTALARRQESARLLLLGSYRPALVKLHDHPLQRVAQSIQLLDTGVVLPLPVLSEPDVAAYLDRRFPNSAVSEPLASLLYRRTGGNPLFMRAVADAWVAQGALKEKTGQWALQVDPTELAGALPNNLRHLIELQLTHLEAADQDILTAGSVAGLQFSAAVVAAAINLPEEKVEARCETLARQGQFIYADGLVEWPDGTVSARFSFSHQLYQEVLSESLTVSQRVRLHRQIGQRLEQGYGSRAPEQATELALHFEQGRDMARAVTYLRDAAERTLQRSAYHEAIEHVTHALELLQRYPDLPERDQHELSLQLIRGPALIMKQGWASYEAEAAYLRARELCHSGNTRQFANTLYGLATVYELRGEFIKTQQLLTERLKLPFDPQDHRLQLESHELLACSTFHQGAFAQALSHADQALTFNRPTNTKSLSPLLGEDPSVSSYHWAGLALWFLGYPDQALARSQTALNQAKELGYMFGLAHAHEQAAVIHQLRREELAVEERAESTIKAATLGGFTYWVGVGTILRGWALAVQNQPNGLELLREGLALCQSTGATIDHPYFLSLLAEALSYAGQVAEALNALTEALAMVSNTNRFFYEAELHRLRGQLLLEAGETENAAEAEACFFQALQIAGGQHAKSLELRAVTSLARLWQRRGRGDEARARLEEIFGRFDEGLDTADLQQAGSLLAELGGTPQAASKQQPPLKHELPSPAATDRFVAETLIATGGMGQVYLGRDTKTGQSVAIKRLRPELIDHNPEAIKRLIREGEVLRQLNHPNIVKMLAMFESGGQPVIVMEYMPGGSLQDVLKAEPQLPAAQVVAIGLELADALARVHHLGILHRDLKPGNVLLTADGSPRLTDFGVARLAAPQESRLTQEGAILGTSVYLSPEAWRGEELDTRSDVWSFGAVLYEMLAGQPPFFAPQITAVLTATLNNPLPNLRQFRPDAPPALVELIQHMLVKEREQRIDSMRQVAAGLEIIQRDLVTAR